MTAYTKWFAVAGLVLMLLAMFAYVASDDEAYPPVDTNVEQSVNN